MVEEKAKGKKVWYDTRLHTPVMLHRWPERRQASWPMHYIIKEKSKKTNQATRMLRWLCRLLGVVHLIDECIVIGRCARAYYAGKPWIGVAWGDSSTFWRFSVKSYELSTFACLVPAVLC